MFCDFVMDVPRIHYDRLRGTLRGVADVSETVRLVCCCAPGHLGEHQMLAPGNRDKLEHPELPG
jgi:hypothetical protein